MERGDRDPDRADDYLMELARETAAAYRACARPRAILLTGSVARGDCDEFSDLDLIAYYDVLPTNEQLEAARRRIAAARVAPLGPPSEFAIGESYTIAGVECQVLHILAGRWEQEMAEVLEGLSLDALAHKKMVGLLEGVPLHGDELIGAWQARAAAFPDALARAMVEHYLGAIFPAWYLRDSLARRDATIWLAQIVVESVQQILGALAGLNRRYYSTFQFKRLRHLADGMQLKPDGLADRLERLFAVDPLVAIAEIEALTGETLALVTRELPEATVSAGQLHLGQRQRPWG